MSRLSALSRYLLLLMLTAGPLQAQTVLLCDMQFLPHQHVCCCTEDVEVVRKPQPAADCQRPPCHAAPPSTSDGCCDSAVEVSYEAEAANPIAKLADDGFNLDPPALLLIALLPLLPREPNQAPDSRPIAVAIIDGSRLYLSTERLRI